MLGRFTALSLILIREFRQAPVKFNADIKYYLHVIVERYLKPDASRMLSAERQKFVKDTFERGDYQAMLATTAPCEH